MVAKRLLTLYPTAFNIVHAGKCPGCQRDTQKFFQLPQFDGERPNAQGGVELVGGYYCEHCGWGNAGSMDKADWEALRND